MVKSLDDILLSSFRKGQSRIRAVDYNLIEHIMLDFLGKDGIGETLEAHILELSDTCAATEELWRRFLSLNTFKAPTVTSAGMTQIH